MKKLSLLLAAFGGLLLAALMGWASARGDVETMQKSPAAMAAVSMVALSLIVYCSDLLRRYQNTAWHHGLLLLHAGLLIVLIAEGWNFFQGSKGMLFVREGMATAVYFDEKDEPVNLPFSVFCQDFKTELYPNTQKVSAYKALLKLTDGDRDEEIELAVNQPLARRGMTFYLQSSGVEAGEDAYIDLTASEGNVNTRYRTTIDAPLFLKPDIALYVRDFSPSLAYQDGVFYTADANAMKNPAYFVEIAHLDEPPLRQWVIVQNPDTHEVGGIRLAFHDFYGIEYAVISVVRQPLQWLTYLGLSSIVIGILVFMRGKRHAL